MVQQCCLACFAWNIWQRKEQAEQRCSKYKQGWWSSDTNSHPLIQSYHPFLEASCDRNNSLMRHTSKWLVNGRRLTCDPDVRRQRGSTPQVTISKCWRFLTNVQNWRSLWDKRRTVFETKKEVQMPSTEALQTSSKDPLNTWTEGLLFWIKAVLRGRVFLLSLQVL